MIGHEQESVGMQAKMASRNGLRAKILGFDDRTERWKCCFEDGVSDVGDGEHRPVSIRSALDR